MNKRKKHVFDTGQIPHLWAHRTQEEARNRQGNLYFTGDTIYSYGSHFPIAHHVANDAGERAVLFTTATYSVTTSSHCSAVRSAIPSGMRVFHVPSVCPGRYSGSELTADDHAGNLTDYAERIEKHLVTSARARSSYAKEWNHEHAACLRDDGNWKKELDLLDEILDSKYARLVQEDENQDLKEEVYRHRGIALMGVGRHKEARSLLEAAISGDYEKELTLYYLGQCYFVLGELKLAKLRIKEALSIGLQAVNELNAHYWLAVAHFRLGEYAWSKLEFEWCLAHLDQGTVARDDILKGLASADKAMEISQRAN